MRPVALLGAPSSIGIRPYDDGRPRRLDLAPGALRGLGLARRLGARDLGDVRPPPYRDVIRPPGGVRNEAGMVAYSRELADRVAAAARDGAFVLLLGGDCGIVLGALLGLRRAGHHRPGLAYVDAHADFATPALSRTGSAASMCLGLAVGRGDTPLARLDPAAPLVRERDVVIVGRRDDADAPWFVREALPGSPMLDLPASTVRELGPAAVGKRALDRLADPGTDGFWIHVDADVLDPGVLPAVDSPEPGGLSLEELAGLLHPLVRHPRALGLELTIYDPALDPGGDCARRLLTLLEHALASEAPTWH